MSATIIELQVEHFKRLKVVRIVPKGSNVTITGKNDQGKSSVLDGIAAAFSNGRDICDEPIHQGEKRARTFLRLSEELDGICTVEKRFTLSGMVLEVKNAEGIPQKNPQALLETVVGKISFDPLSFVRLKRQEQYEMLRKLVGLDFTEINKVRQDMFTERTVRNRELEAAKAKLAGLTFNPSLPKEPVSAVDIAQKLGEVQSKNTNNAQRRAAVKAQGTKIEELNVDVASLESRILGLKAMLAKAEGELTVKRTAQTEAMLEAERMNKEIEGLKDLDVTALQTELANIQTTNAAIEANSQYVKAQENLELLTGTVKALTDKIKECDDDKAAQIEFAQFPMPGLSFDEERGVLLNNVPFSQGSQARQLQAAVAIGLALNPRLKVILVRDASLLDDESMAAMSEQVEKAGAQIWKEVVNSKDPSAIVIEDGEVKS